MAANGEEIIKLFTTRVRQLMLQYKALQEENARLQNIIAAKQTEINTLKADKQQAISNYNNVKTAKMLSVTTQDTENAKARMAKLIREVNKCITLLSAE